MRTVAMCVLLAVLAAVPTPAAYDFGAAANDVIETPFNTSQPASARSYSIWHYQDGNGGSSAGIMWTQLFSSLAVRVLSGTQHIFTADWSTTDGSWNWTKPSNSAWHNTIVVYNGSATTNDPTVYVDGASVTVTETATPVGSLAGSGFFAIGNNNVDTANWDGRLCEFAIWHRAISAGEAKSIGEGKSPLFYPNLLVMYQPLVRGLKTWQFSTLSTVNGATVIEHPRIVYPSFTSSNIASTAAGGSAIVNILNLNNRRRRE
jgi:concanavalin A-like lectin/glucanase superfamily protein